MNIGRYVLTQVLDLVDRKMLSRLVQRYNAEANVRHFGCRQQLICMTFAQLTWREGLRDIAECLNARPEARYHLGFQSPIAKSTLADANEQRDWRLWQDLAQNLIRKARPLYVDEELGLDINNTIYALDSSTIDLSLTLFPWAEFRKTKAGIKMHTQMDLRGAIPTCIFISNARQHDVLWLDELIFEAGAFYIIDRGYMDFPSLNLIAQTRVFLSLVQKIIYAFPANTLCLQKMRWEFIVTKLANSLSAKSRNDFPALLRKVRYTTKKTESTLFFNQQFKNFCSYSYKTLSFTLAHRIVFSLDQRASSYQALLRNKF